MRLRVITDFIVRFIVLFKHHAAAAEYSTQCHGSWRPEIKSEGHGMRWVTWFVFFLLQRSRLTYSSKYLAAAVGPDVFRPDASTLAELLMQIQSKQYSPSVNFRG